MRNNEICTAMVPASELSDKSGYTLNAIRLKRRKTCWGDFSKKIGSKTVLISVLAFNRWCASNYPQLKLSANEIQFALENRFCQLFGIKSSLLSNFSATTNIRYNELVIKAPDDRRMINVVLFKKHLGALVN